MNPREAFQVGARILGLWLLLEAPRTLVDLWLGSPAFRDDRALLIGYASGSLVVGIYLLRGAPLLVRLLMGRPEPPSDPPSHD